MYCAIVWLCHCPCYRLPFELQFYERSTTFDRWQRLEQSRSALLMVEFHLLRDALWRTPIS